MLRYAAITQRGTGKAQNEDRIMVAGNYLTCGALRGEAADGLLAVVCDGIGGEAGADVAAEVTAMSFLPLDGTPLSAFDISGAVIAANRAVSACRQRDARCRNMASTLAGLSVSDGHFIAFNTGDSRVYALHGGHLVQLSSDHTAARETAACGSSACDRDAPEGARRAVTRYIGSEPGSAAALRHGRISAETAAFLLCSDGLYERLSSGDMLKILSAPSKIHEKCEAVVNLAVKNGSRDDISVVLLEL